MVGVGGETVTSAASGTVLVVARGVCITEMTLGEFVRASGADSCGVTSLFPLAS